jgi:hypothetical protein
VRGKESAVCLRRTLLDSDASILKAASGNAALLSLTLSL